MERDLPPALLPSPPLTVTLMSSRRKVWCNKLSGLRAAPLPSPPSSSNISKHPHDTLQIHIFRKKGGGARAEDNFSESSRKGGRSEQMHERTCLASLGRIANR